MQTEQIIKTGCSHERVVRPGNRGPEGTCILCGDHLKYYEGNWVLQPKPLSKKEKEELKKRKKKAYIEYEEEED